MSLYSKYVKSDYCFEEDYVLFILPAKKKKKKKRERIRRKEKKNKRMIMPFRSSIGF
jgi:hypothetical protein